jgi:DNA polymerase/3'-5' exonuclease PolX
MSEKTRVLLSLALCWAEESKRLMDGTCLRIEIAGSIRRGKPDVGDIELVCVPKIMPSGEDLWGNPTSRTNLQLERVRGLVREGIFQYRLDKNGHNCCGAGNQRLFYKDFALDIFGVIAPSTWGVTFLIRTGPSEFNKKFVLQRVQGGEILQTGQSVRNGQLWDCRKALDTPEEIDVFRAVGLPWTPPGERK